MARINLTKPLLITMYGFPAVGKTCFARQLTQSIQLAHIQADKIRGELFKKPTLSSREDEVVVGLMNYMTQEFLRSGVSVIYDTNASRIATRHKLRDLARANKAEHLLVWLQIDAESAYYRTQHRDRRKSDDKYSSIYSRNEFDKYLATLQNPLSEDYLVISGKHTFHTQRDALTKKLYKLGLIDSQNLPTKLIKPELVNRVPSFNGGRVDISRRNIAIR